MAGPARGPGALSRATRSAQGQPEPIIQATPATGDNNVSEVLKQLMAGQIGSEQLIQLLALLAGAGGGAGQAQQQASPIEQAMR